MPNPFMTSSVVSNEDTAAFSDELTKDAQKKEEHYLKGYSSDDPTIVETNKLQDNASEVVEQTLNNVAEVLDGEVATESKVDENPFIPKASPTEDAQQTARSAFACHALSEDLSCQPCQDQVRQLICYHRRPASQTCESGSGWLLNEWSCILYQGVRQNRGEQNRF
jgi:hypothetical protein